MTTVIRIRGKARSVFAKIRTMAQRAGRLTIGEIARLKSR